MGRVLTISSGNYLLPNVAVEMERLRLQARVLEPEAEAMLERIQIKEGWNCVDLGCGGMGILGPLSRRVGASGSVVGVDLDQK
jgi:predicted RNA methylase